MRSKKLLRLKQQIVTHSKTMKPSENFPRTKMHKCNCSYDSHLINIVYWSQSSLELKTGFVRSLEILGKPGFLVLKNP